MKLLWPVLRAFFAGAGFVSLVIVPLFDSQADKPESKPNLIQVRA